MQFHFYYRGQRYEVQIAEGLPKFLSPQINHNANRIRSLLHALPDLLSVEPTDLCHNTARMEHPAAVFLP